MVLKRQLDYKGCATFAAHTHNGVVDVHLSFASHGCLTKAKLWLSRQLRHSCLSDRHKNTQT